MKAKQFENANIQYLLTHVSSGCNMSIGCVISTILTRVGGSGGSGNTCSWSGWRTWHATASRASWFTYVNRKIIIQLILTWVHSKF